MHQPNSPTAHEGFVPTASQEAVGAITRQGAEVRARVGNLTGNGEGTALKPERVIDRRTNPAEAAAISEVIAAETLLRTIESLLVQVTKEPISAVSVKLKGEEAKVKQQKEADIAAARAVGAALISMLDGLRKGTENLMPAAIQDRLAGFQPVVEPLRNHVRARDEERAAERKEREQLQFFSLLQNTPQGKALLQRLGLEDWKTKDLKLKEMERLKTLIVTGDQLRAYLKTVSDGDAPILTAEASPEGKPIVLLPDDVRQIGLMYYYPVNAINAVEPKYLDPNHIPSALIVLYPEDLIVIEKPVSQSSQQQSAAA